MVAETRPQAAARALLDRGEQPIPLDPGLKYTRERGWPDWRVTYETLADYFVDARANVGMLNHVNVDVDLDCPEARALAPHILPRTHRIHGRGANPRSHWRYHPSPPLGIKRYDDPCPRDGKGRMLELLGAARRPARQAACWRTATSTPGMKTASPPR